MTEAGEAGAENKNHEKDRRVLPPLPDPYIHSDIFDRAVENNDNLPGLLAYGMYQLRKRRWIYDYHQRNGRFPSLDAVKEYSFSYRDDVLRSLREEADGALYRFAYSVMEERIEEMKLDALNGRILAELEAMGKRVRKVGKLWHHIFGHIVGFVCLVGVIALLTFAVNHEPSVKDFVGRLFLPSPRAAAPQ